MTLIRQGLWVPCQHWRSYKRLTFCPSSPQWRFLGVHVSQGKFEIGDKWAPGLNSWWLSSRAKLRFCPQLDKNKNDTYFPFSTDMEEIKWWGNLLQWKGKKKKEKWVFFFSFLRTEKIKRTVSRPVHPYFFYFQFSSVTQLCPTLCDPTDYSTPGFPVHHQLLELAQTHVHRVGDPIQPSHPLLFPSLPAFNLSQHQDLFQWVSSSHQVAKGFLL